MHCIVLDLFQTPTYTWFWELLVTNKNEKELDNVKVFHEAFYSMCLVFITSLCIYSKVMNIQGLH